MVDENSVTLKSHAAPKDNLALLYFLVDRFILVDTEILPIRSDFVAKKMFRHYKTTSDPKGLIVDYYSSDVIEVNRLLVTLQEGVICNHLAEIFQSCDKQKVFCLRTTLSNKDAPGTISYEFRIREVGAIYTYCSPE